MADGAAYLISTHPNLYAAIGTAFGDGTKNADGTSSGNAPGTAFNVPDMRGRFMRGVAGSSTLDPDKASRSSMISGGNGNTANNVGSVQGHQFGSHSHGFSFGTANSLYASTYLTQYGPSNWTGSGWSTSSAGGSETRPVNIYVNYIIKQ